MLPLLGAHHIFHVSRIRVKIKREEGGGNEREGVCLRNATLLLLLLLLLLLCKKNEIGGACIVYGENRGVYRVLVGKPEGMRPFGRPRQSWEDSIKMDLQEVGCGDMD